MAQVSLFETNENVPGFRPVTIDDTVSLWENVNTGETVNVCHACVPRLLGTDYLCRYAYDFGVTTCNHPEHGRP